MSLFDMQSPDGSQRNIALIRQLFPQCVTEAYDDNGSVTYKVDFDLLRQELAGVIVEGPTERYQLNWPGKREAILTANAPTRKTLRPQPDQSVNFDTTRNLFVEGDNLEVLKLLQESYLGKVKLIYIDPPYNTGNDFIYKDDFAQDIKEYLHNSGQHDDQGRRLVANTESNGRFHSDWLNMMYARLKLARNLLREDGVIFVSIGDEEIHNLINMCNSIFGATNYRNCLIVRRHDKNLNNQFVDKGLKTLNISFEFVLIYSKTAMFNFNPVYKSTSEKRATQGYWKGFWNDADRPTMRYDILGFEPTTGQWKWKKEVASEAIRNYQVFESEFAHLMTLEQYWHKTGKTKKFIRRNTTGTGKNMGVEHWIEPSDGTLRNTNLMDILTTASDTTIDGGFDFPKNTELLRTIVEFSTSESNDIILDFFAGSATTAHAVMQLNAEDGGNRQFIMVQLPEACAPDSEAAKAGYRTIAEISKERIRRAGNAVLSDWHAKNTQLSFDTNITSSPRDGTGRDGTGRDGTGRDGTGRDGTGRDGTGRDHTARCRFSRAYAGQLDDARRLLCA